MARAHLSNDVMLVLSAHLCQLARQVSPAVGMTRPHGWSGMLGRTPHPLPMSFVFWVLSCPLVSSERILLCC